VEIRRFIEIRDGGQEAIISSQRRVGATLEKLGRGGGRQAGELTHRWYNKRVRSYLGLKNNLASSPESVNGEEH
jgi:hypothetical protein